MAILYPTQHFGKIGLSLGFTYRLLHDRFGFDFGERFHRDITFRVQTVMDVDRAIHDSYGRLGLGYANPFPRISVEPYGHRFVPVMYGCECIYHPSEAPSGRPRQLSAEEIAGLPAWTEQQLLDSDPVKEVLAQRAVYRKILADWPARDPQSWTPMDYFSTGMQNLGSVINTGASVQGQSLLTDYLADPELVRAFYENITGLMLGCLKLFPNLDGASLGRIYIGNCSVAMISPEQYASCNEACDRQLMRFARDAGLDLTIHQDSQVTPHLAHYAELRPDAIDFGQDTDFEQAARLFPGARANCIMFPSAIAATPPDQLREMLMNLMRIGLRFNAFSFSLYEVDPALGGDELFAFHELFRECALTVEQSTKGGCLST